MRPDRGSAAPPRPRCGAADVVAAHRPSAAADADAAPAASGIGAADDGGAGAGGVRDVQLHGCRRCGAVWRHAGLVAAEQSNRFGPGSASLDADRDVGFGGAAQCGARLAGRGVVRTGAGIRRGRTAGPASGRRGVACGQYATAFCGAGAAVGCVRCEDRSMGGAGRAECADGCVDGVGRCAVILSPRAFGIGAAGTEDSARELRRVAPARAGGIGPCWPGRGVRAEP